MTSLTKQIVRRLVPRQPRNFATFVRQSKLRVEALERAVQNLNAVLARQMYAELVSDEAGPAGINRFELRITSQNGEDGILLYLLTQLGTGSREFVEFGVSDGRECNCANLAINFGWHGLMLEGDAASAARADAYYRRVLHTDTPRVRVVQQWVTAENINQLMQEHASNPDILSIDIDGMDYWVWKAITAVRPRIVVIEYNASFGPERAVTVPYRADFDRYSVHPSGYYHGASLAALAHLGEEKGYALVGCDTAGVNAFFVRRDVLPETLLPRTPQQAFYSDVRRDGLHSSDEQFALIQHLPLDTIV